VLIVVVGRLSHEGDCFRTVAANSDNNQENQQWLDVFDPTYVVVMPYGKPFESDYDCWRLNCLTEGPISLNSPSSPFERQPCVPRAIGRLLPVVPDLRVISQIIVRESKLPTALERETIVRYGRVVRFAFLHLGAIVVRVDVDWRAWCYNGIIGIWWG
jgi:hypothetical protein